GLLDGDVVEGIHRHFDVGKVNTRAVRLDADFDVEIDNPFHGNENFHAALVPRTFEKRPPESSYLATAKWPRPYCRISAKSMVSRDFGRVSRPAAGLVEQHYAAPPHKQNQNPAGRDAAYMSPPGHVLLAFYQEVHELRGDPDAKRPGRGDLDGDAPERKDPDLHLGMQNEIGGDHAGDRAARPDQRQLRGRHHPGM